MKTRINTDRYTRTHGKVPTGGQKSYGTWIFECWTLGDFWTIGTYAEASKKAYAHFKALGYDGKCGEQIQVLP